MFRFIKRVRLRIKDVGTISALCQGAETHARQNGEEKPGAEHFLLAAIDLDDGTAKRIFQKFGVNSNAINNAIKKQYADALINVGIDPSAFNSGNPDTEVNPPQHRLYQGKPSVQSMMQELAALRRKDKDTPLLGAHVLQVLASHEVDVVARTLNVLNISKKDLLSAIQDELKQEKLNTA